MAAESIPFDTKRVGASVVSGATQINAIAAVAGKRILIVGGTIRVIGTSGTIQMVQDDASTPDSIAQASRQIPDGSGGFVWDLDREAHYHYQTAEGKGLSFTRSASFAVEYELLYREV